MRRFEVGKTYEYGYICDSQLKVPVVIERRTEKNIWINGKRKKIHIDTRGEWIYPVGVYSMAPVLSA